MRLLPPLRFRFAEDDRAQYGSDWYVYDEAALLRIPARELVEIERTIGMGVLTMIGRARANFTDGNLAAMWVARRLAGLRVERGGKQVPEPFDEFQPLVLLAEWEKAPADDADPPASTSSSSPQNSAE